jgi:hypothetical protein
MIGFVDDDNINKEQQQQAQQMKMLKRGSGVNSSKI